MKPNDLTSSPKDIEHKGEALRSSATRVPFMSVQELSAWIGLKPKTIYDWVETNRIPYHKIGRRVLFSGVEIQRWLNTLQKGPKVVQNPEWETASEMKRSVYEK